MKIQKYITLIFALLALCSHALFASSYTASSGEYTTGGITLKTSFTETHNFIPQKGNKPHHHVHITRTNLTLESVSRTVIVSAYVKIDGKKHMFKAHNPKKNNHFNKSQTLTIDGHQHNITLHCQIKESSGLGKLERTVQAVLSIDQQLGAPDKDPQMGTLTIVSRALVTHNKRPATKTEQDIFDGLTAKVIIEKSEYKIDLAGKSLEQFAKEMQAIAKKAQANGGATPLTKPSKLGVFIELTNTSDKDIKIEVGGDDGDTGVLGKGAGFLSIVTATVFTDDIRGGIRLTLKPKQSHHIPFSMVSGFRSSTHNYWTKPGNCSLSLYATCLLHEEGRNSASIQIAVTGVMVKITAEEPAVMDVSEEDLEKEDFHMPEDNMSGNPFENFDNNSIIGAGGGAGGKYGHGFGDKKEEKKCECKCEKCKDNKCSKKCKCGEDKDVDDKNDNN